MNEQCSNSSMASLPAATATSSLGSSDWCLIEDSRRSPPPPPPSLGSVTGYTTPEWHAGSHLSTPTHASQFLVKSRLHCSTSASDAHLISPTSSASRNTQKRHRPHRIVTAAPLLFSAVAAADTSVVCMGPCSHTSPASCAPSCTVVLESTSSMTLCSSAESSDYAYCKSLVAPSRAREGSRQPLDEAVLRGGSSITVPEMVALAYSLLSASLVVILVSLATLPGGAAASPRARPVIAVPLFSCVGGFILFAVLCWIRVRRGRRRALTILQRGYRITSTAASLTLSSRTLEAHDAAFAAAVQNECGHPSIITTVRRPPFDDVQ